MTNYERFLQNISIESLAASSLYTETKTDYDEGLDGEWHECGEIDEWKNTINKWSFYDHQEALEQLIYWLQSEESWETLGCESCNGRDWKSCNYGYTERCKNCVWYPWADENDPKNKDKWERKCE